jgi:hypothetical protein
MRKLQIPILAATLVAAAACGGDSSTGPSPAAISGTYGLKTINSSPLPYAMPDDGTGKVEIIADSYTLAADGKYTSVTQVRITPTGGSATDMSFDSKGTFTNSGKTVTLTDSDDPTNVITGTIDGTALTSAGTASSSSIKDRGADPRDTPRAPGFGPALDFPDGEADRKNPRRPRGG